MRMQRNILTSQRVLFSHRVSKHQSTKYSALKSIFNQDPVFQSTSNTIHQMLKIAIFLPKTSMILTWPLQSLSKKTSKKKLQKIFKKMFKKPRKLTTTVDINLPLQMLHTNIKRNNRKEWKFCFKCLGPNTVSNMTKNSHCRNLRIWSYLPKKSLTENFIFCAVNADITTEQKLLCSLKDIQQSPAETIQHKLQHFWNAEYSVMEIT